MQIRIRIRIKVVGGGWEEVDFLGYEEGWVLVDRGWGPFYVQGGEIHGADWEKFPEREGYPTDWVEIADGIKFLSCWKCEHCGKPHYPAGGYTLTVHHLNMVKSDCRWQNLVALCQRCHLHWQNKWQPGQAWLFGKPQWARKRGY